MQPVTALILVGGVLVVSLLLLQVPSVHSSTQMRKRSTPSPSQRDSSSEISVLLGNSSILASSASMKEPSSPSSKRPMFFVPLEQQSVELRRARKCDQPLPEDSLLKSTYAKRINDYMHAMRCLGAGPSQLQTTDMWNERLPLAMLKAIFPSLLPMHGGVPPSYLPEQAHQMALLMGMDKYVAGLGAMLRSSVRRPSAVQDGMDAMASLLSAPSSSENSTATEEGASAAVSAAFPSQHHQPSIKDMPEDIIVELGCGNAGVLFLMCPPVRSLACFGTDFAPRLIEHGRFHMPWIDLRVDIAAPHLPTGSASAVMSHGVLIVLTPDQACGHIGEILRLLKPSGLSVLWALTTKPFRSRMHPSFFHEFENGDIAASFYNISQPTVNVTHGRFLQFCPTFGRYVRSMKFIMSGNKAPLFPAGVQHFFAVVVERNELPWEHSLSSSDKAAATLQVPLDAHRRHSDLVEPIIREQEGQHRYSNDEKVSSFLHYMVLANTTALHMHKSKGPYGKFWSVEPMAGGKSGARSSRSKQTRRGG
jgi:hypothetical protein